MKSMNHLRNMQRNHLAAGMYRKRFNVSFLTLINVLGFGDRFM